MSVQIVIKPGGVFENPGAKQSDLIFWYNTDDQPHYPVPGCTGLKVEPGKDTSANPYLPIPNYQSNKVTSPPTAGYLPHTFDYTCAIHEGEMGQITFDDDSGSVVTLVPPIAGAPAKEIVIGAKGDFATVDLYQSQAVFWSNHDEVVHFPVPNCTGLNVKADAVSNDMQIVPIPVLPMAVAYGCAIEGHEEESGTINVFGDFVLAGTTLTLSSEKKPSFAAVPVVTGGKAPYTIVQDGGVPYITTVESLPAFTGISLVLNAAPPAGTTQVAYQLNVTDAFQTIITTTIQVTLT